MQSSQAAIADKLRQKARGMYANRGYYRHVATILRRNVERGGDGSHATDYDPMPIRLSCRLITKNGGAEVEEGDQLVSTMGFELRFPVGSDVRSTDRIQVGESVFSVVALDPERADALFLTATCTRGNP